MTDHITDDELELMEKYPNNAHSQERINRLIAEVRWSRQDSLAALAFMQVATKHIGHYRDQMSAIRDLANARLATSPSTDEAACLWAIVNASEATSEATTEGE